VKINVSFRGEEVYALMKEGKP